MDSSSRVSIITPSFNQAAYLEATIRSVLDQGYPDLEYIVIDGGSTDGSVEIIRRYADRLAYWVSEPDRGQAEGINKGFARATGEIVAWLNSDDIYLGQAIEKAVRVFSQNPEAVLIYSDVASIDEKGETFNIMHYGDWGLDDLMCFRIIGQPGVFMRRSALQKAGTLDMDYHFLLDHQLWLRLAQIGPILHAPEIFASARIHAEAKNVAQAARFGQEAFQIVNWMHTQPELACRLQYLEKRVMAGAHRFNGRYLLDGGQPGPAFLAYLRSLFAHPPTALEEWKRMLYCLPAMVGFTGIRDWYLARRKKKFSQG